MYAFCLPICLPPYLSTMSICPVCPSIHSPSHMLPRAMIFGEDSFLYLPKVRLQERLSHSQSESPVQGRPAHGRRQSEMTQGCPLSAGTAASFLSACSRGGGRAGGAASFALLTFKYQGWKTVGGFPPLHTSLLSGHLHSLQTGALPAAHRRVNNWHQAPRLPA